jgi:hypothetical protein
LANVFEKDSWIRIKSGELNFFGKSSKSRDNEFKVVFSDGHYVKDAKGMRWIDGKIVLLHGDKIAWIKQISRPYNANVASNGNLVVTNWISKPSEHRLGSSLLVYAANGDMLLQHQFESNLNDCNITDDGRICFANTLYPDNTLYAFDIASKQILWNLKDKNASTGKIRIEDQRQIIKIEKPGLDFIRTLGFDGKPIPSETENSVTRLQSISSDQAGVNAIAKLIESSNQAIALETLQKLKSILSRKKTIDASSLIPKIQQIFNSKETKLSDLAFDVLVKIYAKDPTTKNQTIDFLIQSLEGSLDEKNLYRLTRIAQADADSIASLMPKIEDCLKSSNSWNEKRWAAIVIGYVGKKSPNLVKDSIPLLLHYIEHPEVTKQKPRVVSTHGIRITLASPESILGVDPGTWLKDACIDAIGYIGTTDPALVSGARNLLEKIASTDVSEYSRKKARKALESWEN